MATRDKVPEKVMDSSMYSYRYKDLLTFAQVLAGPTVGLVICCFLLKFGILYWPYTHSHSLHDLTMLLKSHIGFALIIASSTVAFSLSESNCRSYLTWGHWGSRKGAYFAICILAWLFPAALVLTQRPLINSSLFLALSIMLVKAVLTGLGEEIIYRGLVQNAATKALGAKPAVYVQAALYTCFHFALKPAFLPKPLFLVIVLLLGLGFGLATHVSKGIGLASAIHIGLDMAVEWNNSSVFT